MTAPTDLIAEIRQLADEVNERGEYAVSNHLDAYADLLAQPRARTWQKIETAPKDGTAILAFGMAYAELADSPYRRWITANIDTPRKPWVCIISWLEGWYDKEVECGEGTYRKERTLSYSYWEPHASAFTPTHWMPLPDPPTREQEPRT